MLGTKGWLILRHMTLVFLGLWLFFLVFAMLIRGPHVSSIQVFWSSVFLSAVVTFSSFAGGWAVKRWEQNKSRKSGPDQKHHDTAG